MSETEERVKAKIVKGRLIPGFEEEGMPFFIIKSDENWIINQGSTLEKDKVYCVDCRDLVEGFRDVMYIDAETRAKKEGYNRKRVCNYCCKEKYDMVSSKKSTFPIPLDKVISTTLGSILNVVKELHSSRSGLTNINDVKKEVLDLWFDCFNRPAYVDDEGVIYISMLGRNVEEMDNKHIEGEDSFHPIGAYIPNSPKVNVKKEGE